MKTMGDYHDLYLKSDILLLADVFENFIGTCLQYYKLDPCHYFTSPRLSWDAMLKMTGIKLELMTDVDMFQFMVVLPILLTGMGRLIISICLDMTATSRASMSTI